MSALTNPVGSPVGAPHQPGPTPVPVRPKKSRWLLGLGIVAAVLIAGYLAYRLFARTQQPSAAPITASRTAKAFVGPLDVTLRLSGQTSARQFANITAPLLRGPESRGGLFLQELAKSGSFVRKGDVVARLDPQSLADRIDDQKDTVQTAQNDVAKREAEQQVEWENMQQTLRVAKAQFDKAKLEHAAGEVRTDVERELLKLTMDESESRYEQQLRDVAFRKSSQEAELKILRITLDRQSRRMNRFTNDLARFTIMAPMDGLIVMQQVFRGGEMAQIQQGDPVGPGQPVMKIVNPATMQVDASVSQADSGDLRIGQRVRIGLDAFPDLKFSGLIHSIGALAVSAGRTNYYIRNVPVKVAIEGSDPRLIPDLSAHGDVFIETTPDQLQVPVSAVHFENGKAFVTVSAGESWQQREVAPGKRSNTHIAIKSGLSAGDEVRLN